jgi:lysophospholipase
MSIYDHPDNPIPEGAVAGFIAAEDGRRLRVAHWIPANSHRRGTVCILHGRAEFIEKYYETVRDLIVRGFAVATIDWRGQGGSQRVIKNSRRGHIHDFADYGLDLDAFMTQVVLPNCPPPYYALGHSTGGLILLHQAPEMRRRIRRYVLTSPFLGLGDYGVSEPVARGLAGAIAGIGLSRLYVFGGNSGAVDNRPFEGNRLTGDFTRYSRNKRLIDAVPDLAIGSPTAGWLRAAFRAMDAVRHPDFAERLKIPTLIVATSADRIVSPRAIEQFAISTKACHLIMMTGAQHELLQEREAYREQFWAAFDSFVPGS